MMYCKDLIGSLTIDIEDWFHILDAPSAPLIEQWSGLDSRVERNLDVILATLDRYDVKATLFWLGWVAEQNPKLVQRCHSEGHEIASHGYGHVLAYKVGRKAFRDDIYRGKSVLEDIVGTEVIGFRAAGFGTKDDTRWTFEEIRAAGYTYDSSVFPSHRGHGGMAESPLEPYKIDTKAGSLIEFPQSMVELFGRRFSLFGGGYLRIAPRWLIKWGITRLHDAGRPLIIYIHPREIDPDHPRLALSHIRSFKSYVNLVSTMPKLEWLCKTQSFIRMDEFATLITKTD
ncbi:MAG: DUF3473 domain-containing protein [Calditrichaeota bacterium]|nr:DUF3473 domain-containing protein [Calditrichota bacterium]